MPGAMNHGRYHHSEAKYYEKYLRLLKRLIHQNKYVYNTHTHKNILQMMILHKPIFHRITNTLEDINIRRIKL